MDSIFKHKLCKLVRDLWELNMRQILVLVCALGVASCVTPEAEWEKHYRDICIGTFNDLFPGEEITDADLEICLEFQRSGINWDFGPDHGDGDNFPAN